MDAEMGNGSGNNSDGAEGATVVDADFEEVDPDDDKKKDN